MSRTLCTLVLGSATLLGGSNGAIAAEADESWWAAVGPDGTQRINVRCGPNNVDPRAIVVKANVPVVLAVSAAPQTGPSNFVLRVPGPAGGSVDATVGPTQQTFAFVTGVAGRYVMACRDASAAPQSPLARDRTGALIVRP